MAKEFILLQVTTLILAHEDTHDHCAYVPYEEADIQLRLGDQIIPAFWIQGGVAQFTLTPEVEDSVMLRIIPRNAYYHATQGKFTYAGRGRFLRAGAATSEFSPAQGLHTGDALSLLNFWDPNLPASASVVSIQAYLCPLRDANDQVNQVMSQANKKAADYVGRASKPAEFHAIDFTPVDPPGSTLRFKKGTIDPQTRVRCFELAGPEPQVPKLIMTSWPYDADLMVDFESFRSSFLLFFHPMIGQAASEYQGPYPYSIGYCWDCGLKYMGYTRGVDPILPGSGDKKGLVHQVAAGGRRVAVVMPVHKLYHIPEIGHFKDAAYVGRILHELHAWWTRDTGIYVEPTGIGRCAASAFSNGNELLARFLETNRGNVFCDFNIREVYSLDPPSTTGAMDWIIRATRDWMRRGGDTKRFRLYSQEPGNAAFASFKRDPKAPMPDTPYVLPGDSSGATEPDLEEESTLLVTPAAALAAAVAKLDPKLPPPPYGYWHAHAIIPATMIVDAVRRSLLPK